MSWILWQKLQCRASRSPLNRVVSAFYLLLLSLLLLMMCHYCKPIASKQVRDVSSNDICLWNIQRSVRWKLSKEFDLFIKIEFQGNDPLAAAAASPYDTSPWSELPATFQGIGNMDIASEWRGNGKLSASRWQPRLVQKCKYRNTNHENRYA